ncbi:hypothetical protein BC835DRAFT_1370856 [Cytidiella melzeri]|nr:hypothetical protein BC835DRAFT_1370856 [Cytidiella melzeri]
MPSSASTVRASIKAHRSAASDESALGTNKAVKTILDSRKCWRNMKGKEEAVWPPELEAALIQGLEKYRPAEAKSKRVLGRFPMRNKFVADHIFEVTGHRRTPKQVGSRIQQLRDTSSGKHILKAISDKHYEMMHPKSSTSDEQEAGPSGSNVNSSYSLPQSSPLQPTPPAMVVPNHVYINTLPPHSSFYSPAQLSSIHAQEPRPLRHIDPTVSFTSPVQSPCQAVFQIYKAGHFVQQEYAPVTLSCGSLSEPGTSMPLFTYSTTLVPQHWSFLCEVEDLSAYTIYLQVVRVPLSSVNSSGSSSSTLLSMLYHFVDASASSAYTLPAAACTPPLSPRSSCGEADFDFSTLSSCSSPSPLLDSMTLRTPPMLGSGGDSTLLGAMPELVFKFEDKCSSLPSTPLALPTTLDGQLWTYSASRASLPPSPLALSSSACDPYMEAAALFDAFVYQ